MTKNFLIRLIFSFTPLFVLLNTSSPQSINYHDLFGDAWKTAETFEKENKRWIEPLCITNHISYPLAISIIFPELVRYSALKDKMEITLLKTLYVNLGEDYADFSIGMFQMKPSFAETIRNMAPDVMGRRSGITFPGISDFSDIKDFRKSVLKDLEHPGSQINYLIVFIKICERNFNIRKKDEQTRIKFLATAYNFGFTRTAEEIEKMTEKKFFNTKFLQSENYSYADVSLYWYNQYLSEQKKKEMRVK